MKIEARCRTCSRIFLLSQIGSDSDAPGRCPFCGTRFARHYSSVLVETVREAEDAVAHCVRVIGRLQGMETGFDMDVDGLVADLKEQIGRHERAAAS